MIFWCQFEAINQIVIPQLPLYKLGILNGLNHWIILFIKNYVYLKFASRPDLKFDQKIVLIVPAFSGNPSILLWCWKDLGIKKYNNWTRPVPWFEWMFFRVRLGSINKVGAPEVLQHYSYKQRPKYKVQMLVACQYVICT